MPHFDPVFTAFNAGELSPRLESRVDFAKYPAGLKECRNLIPLPEGGVTRRPATRYVAGAVSDSVKSRIMPFEATALQQHIVEFCQFSMRFYFRQGQLSVPATDAVITNGTFDADISDWDDRSTGGHLLW